VVNTGADEAPTISQQPGHRRGRRRDRHVLLDGTTGFGQLVDDGDSGDTYNYSPPRQDRAVDEPTRGPCATERGPFGRVVIERRYLWPERAFFGECRRTRGHHHDDGRGGRKCRVH
jgi:hypothetical protein